MVEKGANSLENYDLSSSKGEMGRGKAGSLLNAEWRTIFDGRPKPKFEEKPRSEEEIIFNLETKVKELEAKITRPPIVLVTDFGIGDHAQTECLLAINKTCAENDFPSPNVTEAHNVEKFNIYHGSFIISQLASGAREGTIFVGVVDPGVGSKTDEVRKGIVIRTKKGHYLVGPDNGIFTDMIAEEGVESSYTLVEDKFPNHSTTFHGRDIFSVAAARISLGIDIETFAQPYPSEELKTLELEDGLVRHVDPYGNVKLELKLHDDAVALLIGDKDPVKVKVANSFGDVNEGEPLVYVGSSGGRVELAVRKESAAKRFMPEIGKKLSLSWVLDDGSRVIL
jgi:S-adenosylmethionine hydrolase